MSRTMDIGNWQSEIARWSHERRWDRPVLTEVARLVRGGSESLSEEQADAILAKLAPIHTEVSEAAEDVRECRISTRHSATGKPEGFASELADIVIRVLNLASQLGIDMDAEMRVKMAYNHKRPFRHGGKVA